MDEQHVEKLIRDDNKSDFTSFLTSQPQSRGCDFSRSQLLKLICVHRAVECATSFLEENSVDLNVALEGGLLPLQHAAECLSFRLTSLFLDHGADANVSGDLPSLPLNLALKGVSDKLGSDWSPQKSIYKLLYIFCLRDLKEPLDTIRLLAERTDDIEKVASYCVEEEEIVRLAALLMGAWTRLMPPNIENVQKSPVGQLISSHTSDVVHEELRLMINCGLDCEALQRLKSRKANLAMEWKFLTILEIARDVIGKYFDSYDFKTVNYYSVPREVAYRLSKETKLVLKPDDVFSDDVECLRPKLPTSVKAQLDEAIEKQMKLWPLEELESGDADKAQANLKKELSASPMVSSVDAPLLSYERDGFVKDLDIVDAHEDDKFSMLVEYAIERDKRDEFVELINTATFDTLFRHLDLICYMMFMYDASDCAAALFAGQTPISDPTFLMSPDVTTPLHQAASSGAFRIMALLLQRGFSADETCEWKLDLSSHCSRLNSFNTLTVTSLYFADCLPLEVALLCIRRELLMSDFKKTISAQYCIVHLLGKPKKHLETLRLLVENTSDVKQQFYSYLKEGKMIEVGALLLVGASRLLSSSTSTTEGEFQSISEMYDILLDAMRHLSVGVEKNKLFEMEQTLVLLQIFDRIGDKLVTLLRLDSNSISEIIDLAAASLLEDAGFDVKSEDVYFDTIYLKYPLLRLNVLKRGVDDCQKTTCATHALPCWLKEASSGSRAEKSGNALRLTYPTVSNINRVAVSSLASTYSVPEITPLQHLLKSSAPLVGCFKRFGRR